MGKNIEVKKIKNKKYIELLGVLVTIIIIIIMAGTAYSYAYNYRFTHKSDEIDMYNNSITYYYRDNEKRVNLQKTYTISDNWLSKMLIHKEEIESKIKEYSTSRKEHQPIEYPSAGSTFKRKEGIITAKLIDECGLKGYSIGDAEVSTKHAGFIINKGNAKAKEILELIEYVKKVVYEKTNENIELEVLVIGEK